MSVDEDGARAAATVGDGLSHGGETGAEIGAVDFHDLEVIGIAGEELGEVSAWGLRFDGNGDGVVVVLDQEDDRQLA